MEKKDQSVLLTSFIDDYISQSKRSDAYKRSYRNARNHLDEFQQKKAISLYLNSFTEDLAEEFIYFLRSEGRERGMNKYGSGLMINTIRTLFDKVKFMLRLAKKRGYEVDFGFEMVTIIEENANAVYLTIEELDRLNSMINLSKSAKAVRDRFLIGCFTAMRYSDYSRLTTQNVVKGNIVVKTKKTGVEVVVPLHPIIRQILERNGGEFPVLASAQSFNLTLKRLCRKAGIIDEILYEMTMGLNVVRKRVEKHTLITSHTARRTGATNMYLAGIPAARIMLITGHKTEAAFFKYIRIEKEENAQVLAAHPFFNQSYRFSWPKAKNY